LAVVAMSESLLSRSLLVHNWTTVKLAFIEIKLYWLLQEMRRVGAQPVYFYQPVGGWFWNSPRICLSTLFSNTLSLWYFPGVKARV
jgi:hypothetical protein